MYSPGGFRSCYYCQKQGAYMAATGATECTSCNKCYSGKCGYTLNEGSQKDTDCACANCKVGKYKRSRSGGPEGISVQSWRSCCGGDASNAAA
jgi:hypothetical protein